MVRHQSDSAEQQEAAPLILAAVSQLLGVVVRPRTMSLSSGARVQLGGAADDISVFVEVFARQGSLKGGQRTKVASDALKLITLGREHPNARLVMAFADEEAANYAAQGSWLSEALITWKVEVIVVSTDDETRNTIRAAQTRQQMVNPSIPGPA